MSPTCDWCGDPAESAMDFAYWPQSPGAPRFTVHVRCQDAWLTSKDHEPTMAQLRRDRDELLAALEQARAEICWLREEYHHVSGASVANHCGALIARIKGNP